MTDKDESALPSEKSAEELIDLGTVHYIQRRADIARLYFDAALLKDPDNGRALHNISSTLIQGHLLHAALSTSRRALNSGIDPLGVMMNITAAMNGLGRFDEVLRGTDDILAKMPVSDSRLAAVYHNRGIVLNHIGRYDEALDAYNRGLIASNAEEQRGLIISDRALALLSMGLISEGCREYEVRWERRLYKCKVWEIGVPQWQGEDLRGKRIILCHEQGYGDGIMLIRVLPYLQALGADIVVAALDPLINLFRYHTDWSPLHVVEWNDEEELRALNADYFVPMLSALGLLGLTPDSILGDPYLHTEADETNLGPKGFRIGICWASGYHNFAIAIRRRYVPLHLLFPLSEIPGIRLVSLQKDDPQKDILNFGAESFIHDAMARCEDFADTARVVAGLDLVVSVDSAMVHLAGALGVPVLMLGPIIRCWRWWGGGTGWPWYKNFYIFPQREWGSWDKTVSELIEFVRMSHSRAGFSEDLKVA